MSDTKRIWFAVLHDYDADETNEWTSWYPLDCRAGWLDENDAIPAGPDDPDAEWIAEQAAEKYRDQHDGWEAAWPLTFILANEEGGPEVVRFKVDLEFVPSFSAEEVRR